MRFIGIIIPVLLLAACKANKDEVPVEETPVEGTEVVAPVIEGTDVAPVTAPVDGTDVVAPAADPGTGTTVVPVAPVEPPPAQ